MARPYVPSINEPDSQASYRPIHCLWSLAIWFTPLPTLVCAPPHSNTQELTVSLPSRKTQLTASLSSSFADCVAKRGFLFACHGLQELTASLLTSHTQLTASLSGFPADCVARSSNSWERYGVSKLYRDYSSIWRVVWPRLYSLPWDRFLKTTSFLSNTLCAYFISLRDRLS